MGDAVFVSYSRRDSEYVERLVAHLRRGGFPVWYDGDIPVGTRWIGELDRQLANCSVLVLVMSQDSVASENVLDELQVARSRGKMILPLRLDECQPPLQAVGYQFEDVSGGRLPGQGFLTQLAALAKPTAKKRAATKKKAVAGRPAQAGSTREAPAPKAAPAGTAANKPATVIQKPAAKKPATTAGKPAAKKPVATAQRAAAKKDALASAETTGTSPTVTRKMAVLPAGDGQTSRGPEIERIARVLADAVRADGALPFSRVVDLVKEHAPGVAVDWAGEHKLTAFLRTRLREFAFDPVSNGGVLWLASGTGRPAPAAATPPPARAIAGPPTRPRPPSPGERAHIEQALRQALRRRNPLPVVDAAAEIRQAAPVGAAAWCGALDVSEFVRNHLSGFVCTPGPDGFLQSAAHGTPPSRAERVISRLRDVSARYMSP